MWSRKPTPGAARVPAPEPSRPRVERDVGLARGAGDLRGAVAHGAGFSRISIEAACPVKPSASRDRHPGPRERARAAAPTRTSFMRAPEVAHGQPGGEAGGAVGGQRVVGARDVVAERGAARPRRRTGSRRCARAARAPPRPRPRAARCSGASASAKASAASRSAASTSTAGPGRVAPAAAPARRRARPASSETTTTSEPSPCSAWASRSSASGSRSASAGDDQREVARPGEAVDADRVGDLALGLLDPQRAGPDDHVDARHRSRCRTPARRPPARRPSGRPRRPRTARQAPRITGCGGRDDDDLVDPGDARGDRAHDDRRRIRVAPAGGVDGGAADRDLAHA